MSRCEIPDGLQPYFQEYDVHTLDLDRDADLIIQRTLEHGTWDEVRWLFRTYGGPRIRTFVKERGERLLSPVTFNYWRKLLGIREWRRSPFPTAKGEVWEPKASGGSLALKDVGLACQKSEGGEYS